LAGQIGNTLLKFFCQTEKMQYLLILKFNKYCQIKKNKETLKEMKNFKSSKLNHEKYFNYFIAAFTMREKFLLLLFEVFLLCCCRIVSGSESGVLEVVAPQLRVSPSDSEDLELCFSVKVPDGKTKNLKISKLHFCDSFKILK
jgi:hypothetical protein